MPTHQISEDRQRESRDLVFKSQMLGLVSILGSLFSAGLILGPIAVVIALKSRKVNPKNDEGFIAIVMGIIGFLVSIAIPVSRLVFNV